MENKPLISVIVPVYKVEAYLDRCVSSIVAQTYDNLEILLVDDGSPDHCGAICDAWAEKDSRIRVIHKENGGLSDARNCGINQAQGQLITFVDSDDWLHPDMIRNLYECMARDNSDLSVCGILMVYEDGSPDEMLTEPGSVVLGTEDALRALLWENAVKQPACGKLYKTDLIRGLLFPVGKHHEDTFWTYRAVAEARRVSVFDTVGYYYLQRGSSIMGSGYTLKRLHSIEAKQQMLSFFEERYPELVPEAREQLLMSCLLSLQGSEEGLTGEDRIYARRYLQQAARDVMPLELTQTMSLKRKVLLLLAQKFLLGTARLLNFLIKIHILT